MIKSFAELAEKTREKIREKHIPNMGVIFPKGGKCIEAAVQAAKDGYVKPYLIGPKSDIERQTSSGNMDISDFELINIDSLEAATVKAVEMVKSGEIHFLLKGSIGTKELIDILMKPETGFAVKGRLLSHIGILHTPKYHKLMFVTDGAVNAAPNASDKIKIIQNAASMASQLGVETPKAALLAAVEAIYPAIPVTMEEAAIAKMSDRGQIKDVLIDGPLSFDVAIDTDVAHSKGITNSGVAGDTDIFFGPTMETANGVYKAMVMYAKAEAAGIIYGGTVLMMTTFAADPVKNVINSIILGAYVSLQ